MGDYRIGGRWRGPENDDDEDRQNHQQKYHRRKDENLDYDNDRNDINNNDRGRYLSKDNSSPDDEVRRVSNNNSNNKRKRTAEDLEAERMARMARLRAENEQEEQRIAQLEQQRIDERDKLKKASKFQPKDTIIQVNEEELEGLDEDEQMQALLGFSGTFGTTKGQKVDDNHTSSARGAAAKNKARKYRQYMNRKNGFNRPLDKMD